MKFIYFIVIIIHLSISYPLYSIAQNKSNTKSNDNIISTLTKSVAYTNGVEIFSICKDNPKIDFKDDLEYWWYQEFTKIKNTMGGAGGNLLHGKYRFYDEMGNLINEGNYYYGLKNGMHRTWNKNGSIKETLKYNKGVIVYAKFISPENDEIIEWNGPPLEVGSIKKVYNSSNKLIQTEELTHDYKIKIISYHYNGKIKNKYTKGFMDDWYYDEFIEYYENDQIKMKGKYEEIWKIGNWIWYNNDGTIINTIKYQIRDELDSNNRRIKGGEYWDQVENKWKKTGLWIWFKENGKDWDYFKQYEFDIEIESN